jgi:hypothetical protein
MRRILVLAALLFGACGSMDAADVSEPPAPIHEANEALVNQPARDCTGVVMSCSECAANPGGACCQGGRLFTCPIATEITLEQ